jgi:hypothetical protein
MILTQSEGWGAGNIINNPAALAIAVDLESSQMQIPFSKSVLFHLPIMASAGDTFAPTVSITRSQSFTRTRLQEMIAQGHERDIDGQDEQWNGSMDEAINGAVLQRPRRRSLTLRVTVTTLEEKVQEKDEWEMAEEVRSEFLWLQHAN